jgi:c(7)-type cytochrome triheme protein
MCRVNVDGSVIFNKKGDRQMKFVATILAMVLAVVFSIGSALAVPAGKKEFAGGAMGKVTFDAKTHADKGLKCPDCHTSPKLWEMKKDANPKMTMADMNAGKACGACHNEGKKAFSVKAPADCAKCHKK